MSRRVINHRGNPLYRDDVAELLRKQASDIQRFCGFSPYQWKTRRRAKDRLPILETAKRLKRFDLYKILKELDNPNEKNMRAQLHKLCTMGKLEKRRSGLRYLYIYIGD